MLLGRLKYLKALFPLFFPLSAGLLLTLTWRHPVWGLALWAAAALLVGLSFARRETARIETLETHTSGPQQGEVLFFIHGWPDNHRMWDAQVEHLSVQGYRCVTITLPHFGGRGQPAAAPAWGYDFDELAALCGRTMRASLTAAGRYQGTLVIHDWGCHVGFMLQRLHPELVKRIVAMDVGVPSFRQQSIATAPIMILAGLVYQFWLASAFVIASSLPGIGPPLGDGMTRLLVSCFGERHHATPEARAQITATMNYPYFYFHLGFFLEACNLRAGFDERNEVEGKHEGLQEPPILFFYGADKGFKFHGEGWEAKLKANRGGQNRVVPLPDPMVVAAWKEGTWAEKPKKIGHWLMLRDAKAVNAVMEDWLKKTE